MVLSQISVINSTIIPKHWYIIPNMWYIIPNMWYIIPKYWDIIPNIWDIIPKSDLVFFWADAVSVTTM